MKTNFTFKKIKKGNVVKFIKKRNLREDIPCSVSKCQGCEKALSPILTLERAVIVLDSNLILSQIDALENFDLIDNVLIPQSEYVYLNERDNKVLHRLINIMDNRSFYLFPNEFHKEITLEDEENLKKKIKRHLYLCKTVDYLLSHYSSITKDFRVIVLTDEEGKNFYSKQISGSNLSILTLGEFATAEMKEYPDLYNYIAQYERVAYSNEDVVMSSTDDSLFTPHLTEPEMKREIKIGNLFQGKVLFQPGVTDKAVVRSFLIRKGNRT